MSETPSPAPKAKRAVPPSPGSRQPSRRDLRFACSLLEVEAVEVDSDGVSQTNTGHSEDDEHLQDLSCVTDGNTNHPNIIPTLYHEHILLAGSYSDGDQALYHASLGSQASQYGFGTPMAQTRRGKFQSSYDTAIRLKPTPYFKGTVCPQGHMCRMREYCKSIRYCDTCELEIEVGSFGERCFECDYDLCPSCSYKAPEIVQVSSNSTGVPDPLATSVVVHKTSAATPSLSPSDHGCPPAPEIVQVSSNSTGVPDPLATSVVVHKISEATPSLPPSDHGCPPDSLIPNPKPCPLSCDSMFLSAQSDSIATIVEQAATHPPNGYKCPPDSSTLNPTPCPLSKIHPFFLPKHDKARSADLVHDVDKKAAAMDDFKKKTAEETKLPPASIFPMICLPISLNPPVDQHFFYSS